MQRRLKAVVMDSTFQKYIEVQPCILACTQAMWHIINRHKRYTGQLAALSAAWPGQSVGPETESASGPDGEHQVL